MFRDREDTRCGNTRKPSMITRTLAGMRRRSSTIKLKPSPRNRHWEMNESVMATALKFILTALAVSHRRFVTIAPGSRALLANRDARADLTPVGSWASGRVHRLDQ